MIYLLVLFGYSLAVLMTSVLVLESESIEGPISQRSALSIMVASVVWPLLALGIVWQRRALLTNTTRAVLDLPLINFEVDSDKLGSDFNMGPDESPLATFGFGYQSEDLDDYEVDPDTL